MTTPVWKSGTLYLPGDLVRPQTAPTTTPPTIANADFEDGDTDWIKGTGFSIVSGESRFSGSFAAKYQNAPHTSGKIEAEDFAQVAPGTSVTAWCMVNQGASSSGDAGGYVVLRWYDADHNHLSDSNGNDIRSGSGGAYAKSSVTAKAPANAAYVRIAGHCWLAGSGQALYLDSFGWTIAAPAIPEGLIFKAVQPDPGISASAEPDWPTTLGVQVTDNTVTWEAVNTNRVVWAASPILTTGGTEPDWPTTPGEVVVDGTVAWECVSRRVEDENCPNTTAVAIAASKVFAVDRDVIRFSATANPLDWTTENDAGYLPSGLQQANANDMAVLSIYRGNLVAWNASSFQMWQVDPDPAQMALLDQMDGVGSTWPRAAQAVANDLFYLSQQGVRSVGIANAAENLQAGDAGEPVDALVAAELASIQRPFPLATYYPGAGQYWLAMAQDPLHEIAITGDLPDALVGASGTYQYTVTGGDKPLTFSISEGALPDGATLDSSTGIVTYQYTTEGSFAWTVTVVGADGNSASVSDGAVIGGASYDSGFRYTVEAGGPSNTNDYSATAFDDSAWAVAPGGFGNAESASLAGHTLNTPISGAVGKIIWLRKQLSLPAGDVRVDVYHDDGSVLYWNGERIRLTDIQYFHGYAVIPAAKVTGSDVVALKVIDCYTYDFDTDTWSAGGSPNIYAALGVGAP